MDDYSRWEFPKSINIEEVSGYIESLKKIKSGDAVTFDLSRTVNIHSSFIGFLLHAKHYIHKNDGTLVLILSLTVEKILIMLNIIDYFAPEIAAHFSKKTA